MANGVLSGVLVFLGGVWAWVAFQRLWQQSLLEESAEAMAYLEGQGFERRPLGLRARVVLVGEVEGQPARLVWQGGLLGARCSVRVGGARELTEPIRTVGQVQQLLARLLGISTGELVRPA